MKKKGQGISMETIVIAVIVLAVLAILLLIFAGRITLFGGGIKSCNTLGGVCSDNPCGEFAAGESRATLQTVGPNQGEKQACNAAEIFCCSTVAAERNDLFG